LCRPRCFSFIAYRFYSHPGIPAVLKHYSTEALFLLCRYPLEK
jgi:hypothetical protein